MRGRMTEPDAEANPTKIRERRLELDMTLDELGAKVGRSGSYLSRIETGERNVSVRLLRKIAVALRCDTNELLAKNLPNSGGVNVDGVPVLGAVEAGIWVDAMEWPVPDQYEIRVPKEPRAKNPFALLVKGQSMNLEFPEGSHVICVDIHAFWRDIKSGDFVVVERRSHDQVEATVKQIRIDESGQRWLWPRSSHPDHQMPIRLPSPDQAEAEQNGATEIHLRAIVIAAHKILV